MTTAEAAEQFPTSRRGYDRQAVDDHLAEMTSRLAQAEATIENLRVELEVAIGERQALVRTTDQATRGADEMTARALAEATERIVVAAADARAMLEAADATGAQIVSEARRQAADALADERERIEAEADRLSVLRVAIAAERNALDEQRRLADGDLTALAQRVLALRTTEASSLPSALEILTGDLDAADPEARCDAEPVAVNQLPGEPAEPADMREPDIGGLDDHQSGEHEPGEQQPAVREPEVLEAEVDEPEPVGHELAAPEPVDPAPGLAAFARGFFGVDDDRGADLDATFDADLDADLDDGREGDLDADLDDGREADLDADLDDDLDAAFDAYFAEDSDPEPTRAWMLS